MDSFPSQFPWLSHDGSRGEGTLTAAGAGLSGGSAPGTAALAAVPPHSALLCPCCPGLPLLPSHHRLPCSARAAAVCHRGPRYHRTPPLSTLLTLPALSMPSSLSTQPVLLSLSCARCPTLLTLPSHPTVPSHPSLPMLPVVFMLFSLPQPAPHAGSGPGSSSSQPVTVPGVTLPAQPALRHPVPPLESTGRAVARSASLATAVSDPPPSPGPLRCRSLPDREEPLVAPCPSSAPPGARPAPPSARGLAAGRRKPRAALREQAAAGATWAAPKRTITLSSRVSLALDATLHFSKRGGAESQELPGGKEGAHSPERLCPELGRC